MAKLVVFIALVFICGLNITYANEAYYREPPHLEFMGKMSQENTDEDALLIASYGGFDARNPLVLDRARRNGWSIPYHDLNAKITYNLMLNGANELAVISPVAPSGEVTVITDYFDRKLSP